MSARRILAQGVVLAGLVSGFAGGVVAAPDDEPLTVSREFFYEVWQTEQGLPHNNVLALGQFQNGYLWIATARGLVRFDGVRLVEVNPPGLPASPPNQIHRLLFDRVGNLWLGTQSGELYLWPATNLLTGGQVFRVPLNGSDGRTAQAYELCEDNHGDLWLVSELGAVWRLTSEGVKEVGEPGRGRMGPSGFARDNSGTVWLASRSVLGYFQGDAWVEVLNKLTPPLAIAPQRAGGVWLVADQRLLAVEMQRVGAPRGSIPWPAHDTEIRHILEDRRGAVWMATNRRGLLHYAQGRMEQVPTHHPSVLYLFEDAEGSIWYGTQGGGLGRIRQRLFEVIGVQQGLRNDIVHSIAEDAAGNLWIVCQDGGLAVVSNGVCRTLGPADGWVQTVPLCVAGTPDGAVWVGTLSEGLIRWQDGKAVRLPVDAKLPGERVNALHADQRGRLWVGFHGQGLSCLSTNGTNHFAAGLPGLFVTSLAEDNSGHVYVGTGDGGIARFEDTRFDVIGPPPGRQVVHALLPLPDGSLWAGVSPGGLVRIKQGRRTAVGHAQGLPDDSVFQMQLDENGWLWCGGGRGLFRVSLRELNEVAEGRAARVDAFPYGRNDGLADFPFYNVASPGSYRSRNGRFWFASAKGAVSFFPNQIAFNQEPPRVLIEEVFADRMPVLDRESARLPARTHDLEFQFTALSFIAPEKVRFRYRLDGADADWSEANIVRRAAYSALGPGAYRFQVIACNNDGVWNTKGDSFAFTIPPAFWETRWFLVVMAGLLTGAVAAGYRVATVRRLRRRLARLHEQHALEQERIRIAQDIHDELGASLTQIGMLASFAQKSVERPVELATDLEKIQDTAHEAVRAMDAIVWAISPQNDSLENFAAYVSRFAEGFLPAAGIRFRFDAPADLPASPLGTEQRHQLFLVVREALNNIVRHARASEVWLRLAVGEARFHISIEDNGIGLRAGEPVPGSDGLVNMRQRVETMGGEFKIVSAPGAGTKVVLSVPLSVSPAAASASITPPVTSA